MFLLISTFPACEKSTTNNSAKTIEDLLVKNNEITGWTYSGAGWVAYNATEIAQQIDGAIVVYQRYSNDIEAAFQAYSGTVNSTQCRLRVYVFDMKNSTSAQGVYNHPDLGLSGAIDWQGGGGAGEASSRAGMGMRSRPAARRPDPCRGMGRTSRPH